MAAKPHDSNVQDDLQLIGEMMALGRKRARLNGGQIQFWGLFFSTALGIQYLAEIHNWARSDYLWIWQIPAAAGFLTYLLWGPKPSVFAPSNSSDHRFSIHFALATFAVLAYLVFSLLAGEMNNRNVILIMTCLFGWSFILTAVFSRPRWLAFFGLGWLTLCGYYLFKSGLVVEDYLVLAWGCLLLIWLPAALLNSLGKPRHFSGRSSGQAQLQRFG